VCGSEDAMNIKMDRKMKLDDNVFKDFQWTELKGSVDILDEIMEAREELFETQLSDNLKAHKKLSKLVLQ